MRCVRDSYHHLNPWRLDLDYHEAGVSMKHKKMRRIEVKFLSTAGSIGQLSVDPKFDTKVMPVVAGTNAEVTRATGSLERPLVTTLLDANEMAPSLSQLLSDQRDSLRSILTFAPSPSFFSHGLGVERRHSDMNLERLLLAGDWLLAGL